MTSPHKIEPTSRLDINRPPEPVSVKRILLVSPDSGTTSAESQFFAPPLGVLRLAGYLNSKGHHAEYYDPNLYACNQEGPSLKEKFVEQDWDFIGFSVLDDTLVQDILNIYEAQKSCPGAIIIAGGIEAQFNYQTLLDKSPCRIVILGEGETPLLMLANGDPWQDIPGVIVKNSALAMSQELFNESTQTIPWESVNYEAYWDVYRHIYGDQWTADIEDEVKTVRIFSRNRCPIGCKYCSSTDQLTLATGGKVPVISTTEENLVSVIERVVGAHPDVRMIYLTDDDFVINKLSVIRFCKLIIEKNFENLRLMCFARITDLTEEVIEWMRKANFRRLNIGVESFSQNVLDEVGKRCDADRIHTALQLLKKHGIRPHCNLILTTPQTKLEDIEITLDNAVEYISDVENYTAAVIPAIYPLKGTIFHETYWDYKSYVVDIPGTNFHLRKDDYIHAEDPLVREFQARYTEGADAAVGEFTKDMDIRHANNANLALMRIKFARRLIDEIREEAASGTLGMTKEVTAGGGRLFPLSQRGTFENTVESGSDSQSPDSLFTAGQPSD